MRSHSSCDATHVASAQSDRDLGGVSREITLADRIDGNEHGVFEAEVGGLLADAFNFGIRVDGAREKRDELKIGAFIVVTEQGTGKFEQAKQPLAVECAKARDSILDDARLV